MEPHSESKCTKACHWLKPWDPLFESNPQPMKTLCLMDWAPESECMLCMSLIIIQRCNETMVQICV